MPELTVYRKPSAPPPMVCMYCGAAATVKQEWRVVNRKPGAGAGGSDLGVVPVGDDPVSAAFGLLMLPFVLWELLKGLGAVIGLVTRPRPVAPPKPPAPPPAPHTTLVAVTACDRHRRFTDRFIWTGVAVLVALVAVWVWAVLVTRRAMGTDDTGPALALLMTAIFATVLLPMALSVWYTFRGPVIVDRVTEDVAVLDRVRQAYFDATGMTTTEPG